MKSHLGTWRWRSRSNARLALSGLVCATALGCKKADPNLASQAGSAAAPVASAGPVNGQGAVLSGLDECLVGSFEAEQVTLKLDQVSAEGGAKVALDIAANGASSIDFTPMNEINAKANGGLSFAFKYAGKATATLKTPTRGTIVSESTNLDTLRVNATIKLPGAGVVPLFKDTPVKELANMATAIAGSLPKGPNAAGATNPASGIDASPVFSSSRYTCAGDTLRLENAVGAATWIFKRKP